MKKGWVTILFWRRDPRWNESFPKEFFLSKWGIKHSLAAVSQTLSDTRGHIPESSRIYSETSCLPESEPSLSLASVSPLQRAWSLSVLCPHVGACYMLNKDKDVYLCKLIRYLLFSDMLTCKHLFVLCKHPIFNGLL